MDDDAFSIEVSAASQRRCTKCGVTRPLDMFYLEMEAKRAVREGRRRFRAPCRLCTAETNAKFRAPRLAHTDAVKMAAGCADCGIMSDHPEIYDFDHLDAGSKVAIVSDLLTRGTFEEFVAEIAKCEVVCSNCHRIRTRVRKQLGGFGLKRKPRKSAE